MSKTLNLLATWTILWITWGKEMDKIRINSATHTGYLERDGPLSLQPRAKPPPKPVTLPVLPSAKEPSRTSESDKPTPSGFPWLTEVGGFWFTLRCLSFFVFGERFLFKRA